MIHRNPPQISSNITVTTKIRFNATSAYSGVVSARRILSSAGAMGTVANTTVTQLFSSVKVSSLEIWSPPPSQGSVSTCSVEWSGTDNTPAKEFSDTTMSTSLPAHIHCKPPSKSLAAFWQTDSSTTLFSIVLPSGSVLDLVLNLVLFDETTSSTNVSVATATVGVIYHLALDHGSSDVVVPVSLATTV